MLRAGRGQQGAGSQGGGARGGALPSAPARPWVCNLGSPGYKVAEEAQSPVGPPCSNRRPVTGTTFRALRTRQAARRRTTRDVSAPASAAPPHGGRSPQGRCVGGGASRGRGLEGAGPGAGPYRPHLRAPGSVTWDLLDTKWQRRPRALWVRLACLPGAASSAGARGREQVIVIV